MLYGGSGCIREQAVLPLTGRGNSIRVIDLETEQVIRTITTGLEPESMVLDCNGKLWVLCTGVT